MNKNEKWLKLLDDAKISITSKIKNGEILSVKVNEKLKKWRLILMFDELIEWTIINEVFTSLGDYLKQTYQLNDVVYTVSYRAYETDEIDISSFNQRDYDIIEYFDNAINVCSLLTKSILVLNEYAHHYDKGYIVIQVPTEEDQHIIEPLISLVRRFLDNYGLKCVLIKIEFDINQRNIMEIRQEQQKIKEQLYSSVTEEKYNEKKKKYEAEQVVETSVWRQKATVMEVKITDLPLTNSELDEFKQINGTVSVHLRGVVVKKEYRNGRSKLGKEYNLFTGVLYDGTDCISIKRFYQKNEADIYENKIKLNIILDVNGKIQWDDFSNEVNIMCYKVSVCGEDVSRLRFDSAEVKRVELHAHTKMSVLDSILDVEEYVKQAKNYGHTAVAVTDHANCHVMPTLFSCCKKANIKPIVGVEGYYIDDLDYRITFTNESIPLNDATFCVFDIETTGFSIRAHEIIEIGAVKVKSGMIIDTFSEYIKPKGSISEYIASFTHVELDKIAEADDLFSVLTRFKKFIEGTVLVAHNAPFDYDFIRENFRVSGIEVEDYPCIDTLQIARSLYGGKSKGFSLGSIARFLKTEAEDKHRAIYDARTLNNVFQRMLGDLEERSITNYNQLNSLINTDEMFKYEIPSHITLLVKNKVGLKNFYKIISESHTTYFQREARMPRSLIEKYRDGILVGSGCINGEIFQLAMNKTYPLLLKKIAFYDYLEIQPIGCYKSFFKDTKEENWQDIVIDALKLIIKAGENTGKLVVATGDVHELLKEDMKYRQIYLAIPRPNGGGPHELDKFEPIDMHYRSTTEMLTEFNFLPTELAYKIVVTNTNLINNMIEQYDLFPNARFVPADDFMSKYGIASMKDEVSRITLENAHKLYGEPLPEYVNDRVTKELKAIIGNGYHSVYYISHLLIKESNNAGYVVGSRGSVGSSFVATLMNITEVNPLRPHYVCPHCHFTAFNFDKEQKAIYHQDIPEDILNIVEKAAVGMDLPMMNCPKCGNQLRREGVDIAFETFLGFKGDKVPDIDLNFSGEYQARAHAFCQEVFGYDNAFRAGTVSTVMDKTAFGYVKSYNNTHNIVMKTLEMDRIANFIAGSKKTTGQHPGGIVVVPDYIEYTDVIPVQYPPVADVESLDGKKWRTSHYEYHSFEDNLLKLDILGHDDPTVIKVLMDYVHANQAEFPFDTVEGIPYIDEKVLSLFSSKEALELKGDDNDDYISGTIGIPEFGTNFVRGMLNTIKPKTYNEIIKVSGLSHGTDVWAGTAEDLFKGTNPEYPKIDFDSVIACRDDIMIYLLEKGLPAFDAFEIMEKVRKGKGITGDQERLMDEHQVDKWFIYSCKKIKYLFPRAHATAYVIMALRISWFKIYRPIYYYAAYFSKRAKELDVDVFALGKNAIRNRINEIIEKKIDKTQETTPKEEDLLGELKIALEMVLRGYSFKQIDLEKSQATDFVISEDKKSLYLPFSAVPALGETVANAIIEARKVMPFSSKRDFIGRSKVNTTQNAKLRSLGVLDNLPDDDTLL